MDLHLIKIVIVLHHLPTLDYISVRTLIEWMHQQTCIIAWVVHNLVMHLSLMVNIVWILVDAPDVVISSDLLLHISNTIHSIRLVLPHDRILFDVLALAGNHANVHDCAAHLNNPGLLGLQHQFVLDLDHGSELRHIVLYWEVLAIENDLGVRTRRWDVPNAQVLVVRAAHSVYSIVFIGRQNVNGFRSRLVNTNWLQN